MFDLKIAKDDLLPRLLLVAGAVDKRQTLAILANILFNIDNDQLRLTATDLEIEISAHMPCNQPNTRSAITVPAKKFIDIIRALDDQSQANISLKEDVLRVKAGRSLFKLATLPAAQFPSSDNNTAELTLSIARTQLIYLLQSTHFAMSQQDVRVYLNGLLFEIEAQTITTVGTDGHRMAISRITLDDQANAHRFLLPRKGVVEILRLLNAIADEHIHLQLSQNHFSLLTDEYKMTSKLIDARFPPYRRAIPTNNDKFILIDRDAFKKTLARIMILANEKSRAVLMHIQPGSLTLIANNQEQEEAIESLEAQVDGQEIKIGINAGYLLDVLNYLPDGLVRLSMSSAEHSILVESIIDEAYQYVIMPMKL